MFSTSPLERLERALSPWVAYVIVPVFALANAGVPITADAVSGIVSNRVTLGVILGLVLGKTIGILGATSIAARIGIGALPPGTTWRMIFGLATVAGVGFTVSLFVASLSFDDPEATDAAKLGILLGSTIAGALGYLILRSSPPATEIGGASSVGSVAGDPLEPATRS
jgi:Na+:H+ antiporter, NhaA family